MFTLTALTKFLNKRSKISPPTEHKPAYRTLSAKGLSLAVKAQVLGEVPVFDDDVPTFYVLREYSRSNSLLLDLKTDELGLPSALNKIKTDTLDENVSVIFLKHRHASATAISPRLERLVQACLDNPSLQIRLIPVTILWGRAPDKEDSLFRLLMADEWNSPSVSKQLFNIGVMGRDTVIQFAQAQDLSTLIQDARTAQDIDTPNATHLSEYITAHLKERLDNQRTSIIGPDLSDKRNITGKILSSPTVQSAIEQEANTTGKSIATVKKEAAGYISEITSDYSHSVVRFFDHFLTWLWTRLYDGVEVRHFERVRELAPDHQIIYVPCHRSHVDYLLLSYVIYKRGLRVPLVAAGENLNIPVVGEILRNGGAFFMRRSFKGNVLYSTVFKEYVHTLMQRAVPIEYFIEGGRSRSGRLLPPKLGMLAMTVNSYLRESAKPVVFIPTYISYERIMEGATYVGELKGKPKESENLLNLAKTAKKIERIFGTVHLSFGEPLHIEHFMNKFDVKAGDNSDENTQKTHAMITNIAVKIMQNINKSAVINPVSLLALVILSTQKSALGETQAIEQIALYQRIAQALPYDKDTFITDMSAQDILNYGLRLKLIERTPHVLGDMITVADKQAPLLSYFKNNILHAFILSSFLASLVQRNGWIDKAKISSISELLYPFLQSEFFLKFAQRNIANTISQILDVLISEGVLIDLGDGVIGSPQSNSAHYQQLIVLASPAQQSLERYFMALTLLSEQGSNRLNSEQTVNLCYVLGQRISLLYGDDLPDMFDKALFTSFLDTLKRLDYIQINDGLISFDERIDNIAKHARFVLNPDMMDLLHHTASLNDDEIEMVLAQTAKRKFGLK
ncbi:glycerol-3-phosphate 1-O-acyltransferase PlsB [Moraxella sp. VT-16-12]|uniref:glycerol-3-phosphate 1-O-acyltransferase PlsB n=1 Tax=Moraxella sp. VT-16-12 TaxID=2014877 RepID=UPI000B7D3660|nr:glycerol-3-phosphate 1-O-acyltransferase PlsB [Moraxella sp. VT-16-12]TWV82522.1 glycerol-3-phosphate 1-O-acyltransferase PlsB [Moraxella sp. VT-16-12]